MLKNAICLSVPPRCCSQGQTIIKVIGGGKNTPPKNMQGKIAEKKIRAEG